MWKPLQGGSKMLSLGLQKSILALVAPTIVWFRYVFSFPSKYFKKTPPATPTKPGNQMPDQKADEEEEGGETREVEAEEESEEGDKEEGEGERRKLKKKGQKRGEKEEDEEEEEK
jgi:hypothetical protein